MWDSVRCLANASVPRCRGRGPRQLAPVALFAGPATFPCGQVSSHWKLNFNQASHVLYRSYASNLMKFLAQRKASRRPPQPSDSEENPATVKSDTSGVVEEPTDNMNRLKDFVLRHRRQSQLADMVGQEPALVDDTKDPGPRDVRRLPWAQSDTRSQGWEEHSSGSDTIRIHFEPDECNPLGRSLKLSKLYLRDICQCGRCVCPITGLKNFATCDIPEVPRVRTPELNDVSLAAGEPLEIAWQDDFLTGDEHTSVYSQELLSSLETIKTQTHCNARPPQVLWDKAKFQHGVKSRAIEYHEWMDEGLEFARAVCNLHTYGLVFMRGVPKSWYSVVEIAGRLGNRQYTPRGLTWDDIVEPGKENAASGDVRLHQDSVYLRDRPQIQFMHCLENDSQNDVMLFSDGLNTARNLKRGDKRGYSALTTKLVNYTFRDGGQFFSSPRRVIQLGKGAKPASIAWSPAFQGLFPLSEHHNFNNSFGINQHLHRLLVLQANSAEDWTLREWSRAARMFRDQVESPSNVFMYRPKPGDCVIFDSRRVLYGRKRLDITPRAKHLRGAYVDSHTLSSAYARLLGKGLLEELPDGTVRPRVPSIFD